MHDYLFIYESENEIKIKNLNLQTYADTETQL